MLSAFISSLRTVDLRRKILFTLGIVILYRVGASLPSPGVNSSAGLGFSTHFVVGPSELHKVVLGA